MRKSIGIIILCFTALGACSQVKTIELAFEHSNEAAEADQKTISSLQKVGRLYTVSYHGDYSERLDWLNEYHITKASTQANNINCSLFSTYTEDGDLLLGRNFDRIRETPVLGKFAAPGKYESFAFSPGSEVCLREVIETPEPSEEQRGRFLTCLPFYATDGINEKGLAIAIAGAPPRRVIHSEQRKPMFALLFIRQVLDNCKNIYEVAQFAESVSLYDSDIETISHHFIVTDADGRWLVIDYLDGNIRFQRGKGTSEARTNHFLEGGPAIEQTSFRRYDILKSVLSSKQSLASESEAMHLLKKVSNDTQWSVVYNTRARSGIIAVQEKYATQYHFGW